MRISRAASLLITPSPVTAVLGVGGPAFATNATLYTPARVGWYIRETK
jgi:hypothetical protein